MENLPVEIVSELYSYLDPQSYRRLGRTAKKYKRIGENPKLLKPIIILDPEGKWITKTNARGDCLNCLTYFDMGKVKEKDLIEGMFIYKYKKIKPKIVTVKCPFNRDGYLEGIMIVELSNNDGIIARTETSMDRGKIHGQFILHCFEPQITKIFEFNQGFQKSKINQVFYDHKNYYYRNFFIVYGTCPFEYKGHDQIFTCEDFGSQTIIVSVSNSFETINFDISKDLFIVKPEDYNESMSTKKLDEVLDYLPDWLTDKKISIYMNNAKEIILPIGLFNYRSLEKISESIEFMINRYNFFAGTIDHKFGLLLYHGFEE